MSYYAFLSYSLSYSNFSHLHPDSLHTQLWFLLFKNPSSITYLFLRAWHTQEVGQLLGVTPEKKMWIYKLADKPDWNMFQQDAATLA